MKELTRRSILTAILGAGLASCTKEAPPAPAAKPEAAPASIPPSPSQNVACNDTGNDVPWTINMNAGLPSICDPEYTTPSSGHDNRKVDLTIINATPNSMVTITLLPFMTTTDPEAFKEFTKSAGGTTATLQVQIGANGSSQTMMLHANRKALPAGQSGNWNYFTDPAPSVITPQGGPTVIIEC